MGEHFHRFARFISKLVGAPLAFVIAVAAVAIWGALGPVFHYSDTWQLVINTSTTIVTFLIVFVIQNSQNRDSRSVQLKLDELIRASSHARNHLINLESLSDRELDQLHQEFSALHNEFANKMKVIESHRSKKKR